MKKLFLYAAISCGLPVITSANNFSDSIPVAKHKKLAKVQYGVASFYDDKFEGRKTYTDEIFTQEKMTAASNTLPMHCWARVTNLRNKRSVIVRINDHMHPANPRLIDLTKMAAGKLGYIGRGITRVKVEYLGKKRPPELDKESAITSK